MKYFFICVSVFLFAFGCGTKDEETSTEDQEVQPKFVLVKVGEKKNELNLPDVLADEDEEDSAEEDVLPEEVQATAEETSEDQILLAEAQQAETVEENPAENIEEQVLAEIEEGLSEDGQVSAELGDEDQSAVSGQIVAETIAVLPEDLVPLQNTDSLESEDEEEPPAVVEAENEVPEIDQAESSFEPHSAVAGVTSEFFKPASCRGTIAQLKNSCEFMPEWLKNVQAEGEDVIIRRSRHGVTVIWNNGTFEGGFFKGLWKNGTCKNGTMKSVIWDKGIFEEGCVWESGLWNNGECRAENCDHTKKVLN